MAETAGQMKAGHFPAAHDVTRAGGRAGLRTSLLASCRGLPRFILVLSPLFKIITFKKK